jgi:hypothetical protein
LSTAQFYFTFEEEYKMVCLFALLAGMFPRIADVLIWIARPQMFMNAFNKMYIWPILGIIFLPFTTLMYVIMYTPGVGLTGWDWAWLALAVFLDLTHWGHTAYTNREAIPGYSSGQTVDKSSQTPL